jgi:hypothetical protein
VVELWDEVTRVRAAAVMVETRAAQAEEMAHERAILPAPTHGEANKAARRVFALEGELGTTCWARGVAEEKLPSLAAQVAAADQRLVGAEEQCEHQVHELTLLNL